MLFPTADRKTRGPKGMATKCRESRQLISEILDDPGNLSQGVCARGYTHRPADHFWLETECQRVWIQIRNAIGYKSIRPFSFHHKVSS